jgi:DNA-binding winged helix-turn-helix (wHTH) protein
VSLTFGGHRLDLGARQLFRGTGEVHLSPKAFDLLRLLVEKRPQAVSKVGEKIGKFVFHHTLRRHRPKAK